MLLSHWNAFTHKMLNLAKSQNQRRCSVFFIFLGLQNFCVAAQLRTIIVTIVTRWQSSKSEQRLEEEAFGAFYQKGGLNE